VRRSTGSPSSSLGGRGGPDGPDWLDEPDGLDWLDEPDGLDWLDEPDGLDWLDEPDGFDWLDEPDGFDWLDEPDGLDWLDEPGWVGDVTRAGDWGCCDWGDGCDVGAWSGERPLRWPRRGRPSSLPPCGRPEVIDIQVLVLAQAQPYQARTLRQSLLDARPEPRGDVFACGDQATRSERVDGVIQVLVIERRDGRALQQQVERTEIHGEARLRVDFSLHADLEYVIVPVPMRIVACAEALAILRLTPLRPVIAVRGREPYGTCELC